MSMGERLFLVLECGTSVEREIQIEDHKQRILSMDEPEKGRGGSDLKIGHPHGSPSIDKIVLVCGLLNRQFGCERSLDAGNGQDADDVQEDLRFSGDRVWPRLRIR